MSFLVDELKQAEQARRKSSTAGSAEERITGKNLRAVRQAASDSPGISKTFAIAAGLIVLIAAVSGGIYFWWSDKSADSMPVPTQTAGPLPSSVERPPPAAPLSNAAVTNDPPKAPAKQKAVAAENPVSANRTDVAAAKSDKGAAVSPIHISTVRSGLNPALKRGYAAYQVGNLSVASSEYQQVLVSEPKNTDALHGLAAISLRQGQSESAEGYYQRAIEADPKDALALAGLIALRAQRDPLQAESRLKALLAAQPELPFLNVALGNLYAGQNRWGEAQPLFFKAYVAEPDNPDTLFNLAVSLDHLRQPRYAMQYYRQALVAAENRPASFDKQQVGARLQELQKQ